MKTSKIAQRFLKSQKASSLHTGTGYYICKGEEIISGRFPTLEDAREAKSGDDDYRGCDVRLIKNHPSSHPRKEKQGFSQPFMDSGSFRT